MKTQPPQLIQLGKIGAPDLGYISVAEVDREVPFPIHRVYWTYYTPDEVERGHHAHKELKQVIVAVSGIIHLKLENREGEIFEFELDHPTKGVLVSEGFWRTMRFSHSAVLLCLASHAYEESDYIRDYDTFKRGESNDPSLS